MTGNGRWTCIALIGPALCMVVGSSHAIAAAPAAEFYVAGTGNDRWSGTLPEPNAVADDGPFATLARARDAVRRLKKDRPIRVQVRGGTYPLSETLVLRPEDSGTKDAPVVYEAYSSERPILDGGVRLFGEWRRTDAPNVMSIAVPKGVRVEDLFVNGERQPRARTPNAGFFHARAVGQSRTVFGYEAGQLADWPDAASAQVVIRPYEWVDFHLPVRSIDAARREVTLAKPCGYPLVPGGYGGDAIYHVENVRAALDRPGEWCHDRSTGMLHYWPPAGLDPAKANVVAGGLHVMVSLTGDAANDRWVEHVILRGLTFQHAGREGRWQGYEGTAVRLNHGVRACRIEDCRFADVSACGVVIWKECRDNAVTGCEFVRTGDTAVRIFDYLGEGPPMSAGNRIVNNLIHHCGAVRKSIVGVEISGSENNLVAHNHVYAMPYSGMRLSGARTDYWSQKAEPSLQPPYTAAAIKPHIRSRGNVFELNHIHHVMQELYDGGGIYFWGTMGEGANVIRRNLIHHVGTGKRTSVGIYLDDSCDDVIVRDNVVIGANIGLHLHGAPRNLLENNLFAYCGDADISIQPEAYNVAPMNAIVRRNIFAWGRGTLFRTGEGWNRNWDRKPIGEMDRNLYWRDGQLIAPGRGHLEGFDGHSVVADPKIEAVHNGKLILTPGPAARQLGIATIDLTGVGLTEAPTWVKDVPSFVPNLPLSGDDLRRLPGWQPDRSWARAFHVNTPPTIDGRIADGEWPGWNATTALRLEELAGKGGRGRSPSTAYLLTDGMHLYVMLRNAVADASALRREGGDWGKDDGAEVCLQAVTTYGKAGPIFVLRGYPSGAFESSTEAGAPREEAESLGKATTFAAEIGTVEWTAEYAIPLDVLSPPDEIDHLRFNVGVFKKAEGQWIAWVGTGKENWRVADAGVLTWRPSVAADAKNLLANADLNAGKDTPDAWSSLWWNTSNEPRPGDRDPKCDWTAEGIDGSRCFRIHSADRDRMRTRQGGFHQVVPSPGPGRYLLTFDLKADDLAVADASQGGSFSAYVHVVRKDGSHGANLGADEAAVRDGSFDWLRREVLVIAPADAETLTIIFQFQRMTGTVWVDNVTFRRIMPQGC